MERIKAADLYEYRFLSEVTVSPDGAHTAFVARNARPDGQGYESYVWLIDNASGALRRMTGSASDASLRWLDENTLIFISARGGAKAGRTEFYTLDIRGGEAALAFTVPLAVASAEAARDWLEARGVTIFAAAPAAEKIYWDCDFRGPAAILAGAEATGLTDFWLGENAARDSRIVPAAIPQRGAADSLNVATAAAIFLFEALRQRSRR